MNKEQLLVDREEAIRQALQEADEDDVIYIHRYLGDGFTHFESSECGCCPHAILGSDKRSPRLIALDLEQIESLLS